MMRTIQADIAIIGASLGGVQAARAACMHGMKVYLCEETDWIGGQLTSQAVPPDEHRWIEEQGAPQSYLDYRKAVREYYRHLPDASELLKQQTAFCPGQSWVSRVAHDPRIALRLLEESLQPYLESGLLTLDRFTAAQTARAEEDEVKQVTVRNHQTGEETLVEAQFFLDGTDCGDLLPLTGTEYVLGAESQSQTGEPDAPEKADAADTQPITWVAALELTPEHEPMDKPALYDEFAAMGVPYADNKLLSWYGPEAATGSKVRFAMFNGELEDKPLGLWSYRRVQYPPFFTTPRNEVTLLNWPQNDYTESGVIDVDNREEKLERARQQTLSLAYWLWEQGYNIRLCPEMTGTPDGLAKAPYIRESRRIVARHTIREQDVIERLNPVPPRHEDSVGVGHYNMDLHQTITTHSFFFAPVTPFEIPLGALIPVRMKNLLPACKNIGTTHLTGGCYRLHPVEWNIGESAGTLAAFCVKHEVKPADVLENKDLLTAYQQVLEKQGVQLHWKL